MPIQTELRLYDADGVRQPLPDRFVAGWDFELVPRGGCAAFSLTYWAELDDGESPALPAINWRFEVLFDGVFAYRGTVEQVRGAIQKQSNRPTYRITGGGLMGRFGEFLVDGAFAKPYGADISEFFAKVAGKFLVGPDRLPDLVTAIGATIGYTVERVELFGTDVRRAFDRMAQGAQDTLIWGCDVTPGGADRLYVARRSTTVDREDYRFRVGRDVTYYEQPEDLGEVVNAVRLIGGEAKAPNLLHNPSFERPALPGEGKPGNLLTEPSFEQAGGWTYGGTAARQQTNGEPGEYSRTGNWFAEIDAGGDYIEQTVTLENTGAGQPLLLSLWYAKQAASGTAVFKVRVRELKADNTVLTTLIDPNTAAGSFNGDTPGGEISDAARSYQEFRQEITTEHADAKKIEIRISWDSGPDVLLDDVYLYEADALAQRGWGAGERGTARAFLDWICDVDPFHGLYCVRARVRNADNTDANTVRILPFRWVQARERTSYAVKVRVRCPNAGEKVRVGLAYKKAEGGVSVVWGATTDTVGGDAWQTVGAVLTVTAGAQKLRPIIELRSSGVYYLDAAELYEHGIESRGRFLTGDRLEFYYRADAAQDTRTDLQTHAGDGTRVRSVADPFGHADVGKILRITGGAGWTADDYEITEYDGSAYVTLAKAPAGPGTAGGSGLTSVLPGLTAEALASIGSYGLRERTLEVDQLEDKEQARLYATGYLNRYAVPLKRGQLTLEPCDVHLRYVGDDAAATPQGLVAITGAQVAIPSQFPVRILYSQQQGGYLRCELELTNRRPDPALLLKKDLERSGGSGGSGGAGVNLRDTPGNSGEPADEGSAATYRVDGSDVGSRPALNLVAGTAINLSGVDDAGDEEAEVTITVDLGTDAGQAAAGNHTHAHSALTGIGADDHHAQVHALIGPDHTGAGTAADARTALGLGGLAVLAPAAADPNDTIPSSSTYMQAAFDALVAEVHDLKDKLRAAGILTP